MEHLNFPHNSRFGFPSFSITAYISRKFYGTNTELADRFKTA